ncbi:MAG TPA: zinc-binding dehydrogenase [Xanthobacteraceae bacterium]
MRAIVIRRFGPPEVMRLEQAADPEPGPDDVLVEVHAVSVNRTLDLAVRAGTYARLPSLPHVLGVDPSGKIVATGRAVTERRVGQPVVARPILGMASRGHPLLLGLDAWGGYAQYVKLPAAATRVMPEGLAFSVATVISRHAPLAFAQLRDKGQLQHNQWVLILGAAGGLGSAAVQVAKYLGGLVIAGAGSDERVDAAMELGADAGVNYRERELNAEVLRITKGAGVSLVLDNMGDPELFPQALACLAPGGRLVTAGAHAGGKVVIDLNRLYQRQLAIVGAIVDHPDDLDASLRMAAEGRFRAVIDRVLPLSEAVAAHEMVERRSPLGKVILDPTAKP